jgi:hypothetical protein
MPTSNPALLRALVPSDAVGTGAGGKVLIRVCARNSCILLAWRKYNTVAEQFVLLDARAGNISPRISL